jgi:uncharacterized protein
MLRVVLDTHIIVSGLLNAAGAPAAILDLAASRRFRCFVSDALLEEYRDVLARPRFRLNQDLAGRFLRSFREVATRVTPRKKVNIARDRDDDCVIECALEAKADFVVTGNIRDFPRQVHGVRVVSPRDFLFVLGTSPHPL